MENFQNFINNTKENSITQHLINIFPDLDSSYKILNKILTENKSKIETLITKIITNNNYQNFENENNILPSNTISHITNYGFLFKYNKKFTYSKNYKYIHAHEGTVECACELNNGQIATCGNDLTIRFWHKYATEPHASLFGHTNSILSLIQLKNGLLVSASVDNTIRIWDIKILQPVKILTEHQGFVIKLYQLKNSKFVSCSGDGTLRIWDPLQNYTSIVLKGHKDTVEKEISSFKT